MSFVYGDLIDEAKAADHFQPVGAMGTVSQTRSC